MPENPAFISECVSIAAPWAERHDRHGINYVEVSEPSPSDDPGTPPHVGVWVVESPDLAYYAEPREDGWKVFLTNDWTLLGTAPDLIGALQIIRPDTPEVLRELRAGRVEVPAAA